MGVWQVSLSYHNRCVFILRILWTFTALVLCTSRTDGARKLEQQELEATYKDAWAVGGSEESDCVCRGGRCPRMWDCPFWVDRRQAEAKGSSAHVSTFFLWCYRVVCHFFLVQRAVCCWCTPNDKNTSSAAARHGYEKSWNGDYTYGMYSKKANKLHSWCNNNQAPRL